MTVRKAVERIAECKMVSDIIKAQVDDDDVKLFQEEVEIITTPFIAHKIIELCDEYKSILENKDVNMK